MPFGNDHIGPQNRCNIFLDSGPHSNLPGMSNPIDLPPQYGSGADFSDTSVSIELHTEETHSVGYIRIPLTGASHGDSTLAGTAAAPDSSAESLHDAVAEQILAPPPAYHSLPTFTTVIAQAWMSAPPPGYYQDGRNGTDDDDWEEYENEPAIMRMRKKRKVIRDIAKLLTFGILLSVVGVLMATVIWKVLRTAAADMQRFETNAPSASATLSNDSYTVEEIAQLIDAAGPGSGTLGGLECFVVVDGKQTSPMHLWDFGPGKKCEAVENSVLNSGDKVKVLSNDTVYAHCDGPRIYYRVSVVGTIEGHGATEIAGYFPADLLQRS